MAFSKNWQSGGKGRGAPRPLGPDGSFTPFQIGIILAGFRRLATYKEICDDLAKDEKYGIKSVTSTIIRALVRRYDGHKNFLVSQGLPSNEVEKIAAHYTSIDVTHKQKARVSSW